MIIPPDDEKDATLFSPTSSTPSLVPPPSESDIEPPPLAYTRNSAFGYPFGSARDDLGVGYTHNGEHLPPYPDALPNGDGQYSMMRERSRRSVTRPHVSITTALAPGSSSEDDITPRASTSTSRLPYTDASSADTTGSTSKLWESSRHPKKKGKYAPTLTPGWQQWWKKYGKWVYVAVGLLLAGIGLMIGLLVGMGAGKAEVSETTSSPWKDKGDGKTQNWVSSGESLNITYVPSRDGPFPSDGNVTSCPMLLPLNASAPITLLSRTDPAVKSVVATFDIPLAKNGSALQELPELRFIARGLGSSGTIEIVGSDAPEEVLANGKEGVMRIEVVAMYSGPQDLDSIVRVCQMSTGDKSIGIGIFTPCQTDGKVTNAYMLNPVSLPSFHIVVYPPPSAFVQDAQSTISIPNLDFSLDRMTVRFGNMQNIVEFGSINVSSLRGGLEAGYIAADTVDIRTGENAVRGTFNITRSMTVNNTDGSVIVQLVLHDANSTTPSTVPAYEKRSPLKPVLIDKVVSRKSIDTTFMTGEGLLEVKYLTHPTSIALSSTFVNGQGETFVSLHPNYLGSFICKTLWGMARIPRPAPLWDKDPQGLGRKRALTFGRFEIPTSGLYADNGFNTTILEESVVTLSGVAYWQGNTTLTPAQVLARADAQSEVLILGAWGDTQITVDGT